MLHYYFMKTVLLSNIIWQILLQVVDNRSKIVWDPQEFPGYGGKLKKNKTYFLYFWLNLKQNMY